MKTGRRRGREEALQVLYELDMNREITAEVALKYFEELYALGGKPVDEFCRALVLGVTKNLAEIDGKVRETSEHWRPDRMAAVDRNILRLGVYELLYCDDIPATVTINEMIEIAKAFGAENTPAFVNGILDKLKSRVRSATKAK